MHMSDITCAKQLSFHRSINVSERQEVERLEDVEISHFIRYKFATSFIHDNDYVLDAMCGVGYGSYLMARDSEALRIDAFDVSRDAIVKANKHFSHPKINFANLDFEKIRVIEEFYHLITCFEAIEHINNPMSLLLKLHDGLKENGTLLLSTPNESTMPHNNLDFPEHITHYTYEQMEMMTSECGLHIDEVMSQPCKGSPMINSGLNGKFLVLVCKKQ